MSNILSLAGENSKYKLSDAKPAGFLSGIWHGILMPIALLASLFNANISIYETYNNRGWYHWGMIIGIQAISGNSVSVYIGTTTL